MAQTFKAVVDGNGRVRYFVDGAEQLMDEYVQKYVKVFAEIPVIPVGLGGRAPEDPVPTQKAEMLEQELATERATVEHLRKQLRAARGEDVEPSGDEPLKNNDADDDGA